MGVGAAEVAQGLGHRRDLARYEGDGGGPHQQRLAPVTITVSPVRDGAAFVTV